MSDSDGWVVDRGLLVLRDQINAAWPNRDKGSDGTIGDAAHSARDSDHNPESPPPAGNPDRQVDALDVTHDPAHGADMGVVSEAIRASRDQRVKYVIFARRIVYPAARNGFTAWAWQPYSGSDPHTGHMHVSVNDVHHDETQLWEIGIDMTAEVNLTRGSRAKPKPVGNRDAGTQLDDCWAHEVLGVSAYDGAKSERGLQLDRIEAALKAIPGADPAALEAMVRRVVREEIDKTKLGSS